MSRVQRWFVFLFFLSWVWFLRIVKINFITQFIGFQHKAVEQEGKSVVERLHELQLAKEQLQVNLVVAAERIDYLEAKCERRKIKAIHKIQGLK